jgi:UDP-N-acetylglucosamine--N-acetylmuramyl-(pentapeptide) pyrophosphoryl-undecaprenol N-acetylglucosamine transferase
MKPRSKIVITGGGTGGHVFPALAISEELIRRGFSVVYVGSPSGFEARFIPDKGIPFIPISSGAVKNQSFIKIFKSFLRILASVFRCIILLKKERPSAVIGVGGYVSVPTSIAAYCLRIPLFLQEQNTSVGIANRFLGRLSNKIFLGFPQAESYFNPKKCIVTGNPIRQEFFAETFPKYDPQSNFLLIMGGSQGAIAINDAVIACLPKLKEKFPGLKILHQTGVKDKDRVEAEYKKYFPSQGTVIAFITDVVSAYAKASVIVARSGALTVAELIQVGRPAVLVPYPRKGQNDQTTNAYYLEQNGAAKVVEQGNNFNERFWNTLLETMESSKLSQMALNFSRLRSGNALVTIGDRVEEAVGLG